MLTIPPDIVIERDFTWQRDVGLFQPAKAKLTIADGSPAVHLSESLVLFRRKLSSQLVATLGRTFWN